jgi:hypothetical protein
MCTATAFARLRTDVPFQVGAKHIVTVRTPDDIDDASVGARAIWIGARDA